MLYRKTIIEEYTYESEEERNAHVAIKIQEGFTDSGQMRERIHPAVMLAASPYPVWDTNPEDFIWYAKFTKVEAPGMYDTTSDSKLEDSKTNQFGIPDAERKLRRLHEMALVGVGDSKEGRRMINDCYLTLLELV